MLKEWGTAPAGESIDFGGLFKFYETHTYDIMQEIAVAAARLRHVPDFDFDCFDLGRRTAWFANAKGSPFVLLDDSLITFLFLFFCNRCFEFYVCDAAEEKAILNNEAVDLLHSLRHDGMADPDLAYTASLFPRSHNACNFANSLTYTAIYFVLCHELAHFLLGHSSRDIYRSELAADDLGIQIYNQLARQSGAKWTTIPDGYMGAPLLLFNTLYAAERLPGAGDVPAAGDDYPPARERRNRIRDKIEWRTQLDRDVCRDLRLSTFEAVLFARRASRRHG